MRPIAMAAVFAAAVTVTAAASGATAPPGLASETRQRLAEAAADEALTPWQREFMLGMTRGGDDRVDGAHRAGPYLADTPEFTTATAGSWAQLPPPAARGGHTAIYDPVRDRMVVFDGYSGGFIRGVWELSLAGTPSWTLLTISGTPPSARYFHTAIYDPVDDRMVVFGGNGGSSLNDVWALSLAGSPAWSQLTPTGTPPSARDSHTATYDPLRNRMLVFGGRSGSLEVNDVWELSLGGSPVWTQLTPAGTPPGARFGHTAIYDTVRDRMLVFGGHSGSDLFGDVWALSLAGGPEWTQLTPTGLPPTARYAHTAIYDPARDRMVVFGGNNAGILKEVWALWLADGPAWTQLTPAGPPAARYSHAEIYDPVRDRMVVFGGYGAVDVFEDVWALSMADGQAWTQITPAGPPSARGGHTAIHDPVRDRMVVFGGMNFSGPVRTNDVWALSLDGVPAWTRLTPAGILPSARVFHSAIYDPVRDRMVVFGGNEDIYPYDLNEVWALSFAGNPAWTKLTPVGTPPSPRESHTAIYDPVRDRMVVFGGTALYPSLTFNDVWALSLTGSPEWIQVTPAGTPPSPRRNHTSMYDPVRDRMVVFGGMSTGLLNEVWALSLAGSPAWTHLTPAGTAPSARFGHTALFDPVRDRMVVFGGNNLSIGFNDVWAMSLAGSSAWTPQNLAGGTPQLARYRHSAIYDPVSDRMIAFGGWDGVSLNDAWELDWSATLGAPPLADDDVLRLAPAYPNPTRGDVWIGFALPTRSKATLRVYDVSGREVRTLLDGSLPAGAQTIRWDRRASAGALAPPGLYFYELRVEGRRLARKIVLTQ